MYRRALMAEVCGDRVRGSPRLVWIDRGGWMICNFSIV